ncbi:MAG: hypothetical protein ACI4T1_02570 [Christensenellales bacterium]
MKNKNKSVLKELISSAKERLKNRDYGNYTYNLESKKQDKIKTNQVLRVLANKEFKRADIQIKTLSNEDDVIFNNKVIKLLQENPNTISPLAEIIDIDKYMKYNDIERQKYILQISEKFVKIKEEYYKKQNSL